MIETPMNGQRMPSEQEILADLESQLTLGYRPTLPIEGMFSIAGLPQWSLRRDMELMLTHPDVRQALAYFKGGISGAQFWGGPNPVDPEDEEGIPICAENPQIGQFVKSHCEKFWDRGVPSIQSPGYEYGWVGGEHLYDDSDGILRWEGLKVFSPADTFLLTQDQKSIGIRVKNVQNKSDVNLWFAGDNVPAKGLWYAHQPRFGSFYGQSQLLAAWRPWRRLAWKDGAESVLDMACYRFGVGWVIARYPDKDIQGPLGSPNTTADSQGNPRRYARDMARQIAEQAKAGAAIGLSSKRDATGNYEWDLQYPTGTLQGINNLLDYVKYLRDQITAGIGVPPELLEAAETGSGYSGRRIPLEAFLANQQQIADAILKLYIDQVVRPLVHWNWGPVKFSIQVKSLIKTRTKDAQAATSVDPNRSEAAKQAWQTRQQGNPQQQQPQQDQGAMFSNHSMITDRVRELARKIVRAA